MLFVDTWAWYAMGNRREPAHVQVHGVYREALQQGQAIHTTDYILDELITLIFRNVNFKDAHAFVTDLLDSIQRGFVRLERITSERFEQAWQMRAKYSDKPMISFTDFTSFAVMRELGITEALTDDEHYRKVNLGFRLRP